MQDKKISIIVGPTASGKSLFALEMAHKTNAEIVNADSLQVYQDLQVLSARPLPAEMQGIKHHLYGYLGPHDVCTMAQWLNKATCLHQEKEHLVFVGGTGLYIKALMEGVNPIPDVDLSVRELVRNMPLEEVKAHVIDCAATDPQRLRRALEVQLSSGKPLSYFYTLPKIQNIKADFDVYFINPPREVLYQRCNTRFEQMINQGALEEVQALMQKQATGGVLKAIGVAEIMNYLQNKITKDKMIEQASQATRRYAKRQVTWFKNQLSNVQEIN